MIPIKTSGRILDNLLHKLGNILLRVLKELITNIVTLYYNVLQPIDYIIICLAFLIGYFCA
jgi:hypothetical protein